MWVKVTSEFRASPQGDRGPVETIPAGAILEGALAQWALDNGFGVETSQAPKQAKAAAKKPEGAKAGSASISEKPGEDELELDQVDEDDDGEEDVNDGEAEVEDGETPAPRGRKRK